MGGTLAEMAEHVRRNGGEVIGVVTLVNAGRSGIMTAPKRFTREIERRFGDAVRQLFGAEPAALTADEAQYIIGFRDADALRDRVSSARRERGQRLLSKGLRPPEAGQDVADTAPPREGRRVSGDGAARLQAGRGAPVRPGDTSLRVPPRTMRWLGFERLRLVANTAELQRRHPEYYRTPEDVERDIRYVMAAPDDCFPHADRRIFPKRAGAIPAVRLDFRIDGDAILVTSVYVMNRTAIAEKMRSKRRVMEGLGQGGQSPGRLSVAEFLRMGCRSSAPAEPSGSVHQAPATI